MWWPFGAAVLRIVEEFAWPGGFRDWYAGYRPAISASLTPRFLVTVNAVLLAAAALPIVLGPTRQGVALWLSVANIEAANACLHLNAVIRMRRYSPGVVTGLVLYLPFAGSGFAFFVRGGDADVGTAIAAAMIGPIYHLYSRARHRRHTAVTR